MRDFKIAVWPSMTLVKRDKIFIKSRECKMKTEI